MTDSFGNTVAKGSKGDPSIEAERYAARARREAKQREREREKEQLQHDHSTMRGPIRNEEGNGTSGELKKLSRRERKNQEKEAKRQERWRDEAAADRDPLRSFSLSLMGGGGRSGGGGGEDHANEDTLDNGDFSDGAPWGIHDGPMQGTHGDP